MSTDLVPADHFRTRTYPAAMAGDCALCGGPIQVGEQVRFNAYMDYIHPDQEMCAAVATTIKAADEYFLKSIGVAF